VDQALQDRAKELLAQQGWRGGPIVTFAPGAAFGVAKRWPPDRVGALAAVLARDMSAMPVLVGAAADVGTAERVRAAYLHASRGTEAPTLIDLTGRTDLRTLAAVLARSATVVSNDSGAMHVAAAVGAPVVALFGPTSERRTSPLEHASGAPHALVAGDAWCRPCELRTCPLDHRCMTSISVDRVADEVRRLQSGVQGTSPGVRS
jgi:heptosyltransferase-2